MKDRAKPEFIGRPATAVVVVGLFMFLAACGGDNSSAPTVPHEDSWVYVMCDTEEPDNAVSLGERLYDEVCLGEPGPLWEAGSRPLPFHGR